MATGGKSKRRSLRFYELKELQPGAVSKTDSLTAKHETSVFEENFIIGSKIGSGSFGETFSGTHRPSGKQVAIKTESIHSKYPQLQFEYQLYSILHQDGVVGVPRCMFYGRYEECNMLVMDLLGPTIQDLYEWGGRAFSHKTILMLAEQMLQRLEHVHKCGFVHRDVKPENFLMGCDANRNTVYLIDFGLSQRYCDAKSGEHFKYSDGHGLTGTSRYASLKAHAGVNQTRRDDLEALAYVLIYFCKGRLPWQGLTGDTWEERQNAVMQKKRDTPVKELCMGVPGEFMTLLEYARGLDYAEKPDYEYCRDLFSASFKSNGYEADASFDWTPQFSTDKDKTEQKASKK